MTRYPKSLKNFLLLVNVFYLFIQLYAVIGHTKFVSLFKIELYIVQCYTVGSIVGSNPTYIVCEQFCIILLAGAVYSKITPSKIC